MTPTKTNFRTLKTLAVLVVIFSVLIILAAGVTHAATSSIVVDPANVTGTDNNMVSLVTSYPGVVGAVSVNLDARESWVKLSFSTNSVANMRIYNGCHGTNYDFPRDGSCHRSGTMSSFRVFRTTASGALGASCGAVAGITSTSTIGGNYVLVSGWSPTLDVKSCLTLNTTTGFYELLVRSQISGPGINGFKVRALTSAGNNALAGFADSASTGAAYPTAVMSRQTPSNDPNDGESTGIQNDIVFEMRRTCDAGVSQKLNLRWDDADHTAAVPQGAPPDAGVYFTIVKTSESGVVTNYDSRTLYDDLGYASHAQFIGGDGAFRNITFNVGAANIDISPGDKVVWTWNNIRRINGVQVYIPYDNNFYNSAKICSPQPVPGGFSVTAVGADHERGSGDKKVKYYLNVATSGCLGNATVVWGGDGVADVSSTVPCGTAATYPNPTTPAPAPEATVSAATLDAQPVGTYTSTFNAKITSINGVASATVSTGADFKIYEVPFARFFGSDVRVCDDTLASKFLWDDRVAPAGNATRGAFANLAAIFASRTAAGATAYDGVHTITPAGRDTLDSAWAGMTCVTDLSSELPTTASLGAVPNLNAGTGARYYTPGAGNTNISGNLTGQVTINTAGSITITGDIISSIPIGPGPFTPSTAPVLVINAANIYIAPSVQRVDAILIASNSIHTCKFAGGATPLGPNYENLPTNATAGCRETLIVNGALSAGTIHLERSTGTRLLSNVTTTAPGYAEFAAANDAPAEIINYPGYLNFMPLNTRPQSRQSYDAYTILPPRL